MYLSRNTGPDGVDIVDVSDPTLPVFIAGFGESNGAAGLCVAGQHVYFVEDSGLSVTRVLQDVADTHADTGQSLAVGTPAVDVQRVRLSATEVGLVDWEVTADGGASWQAIDADGNWNDLSSPGQDLRWRATLSYDGVTLPACSSLALEWEAGESYCVPGTSASGCQATLSMSGVPSASAASGFTVHASNVEGAKDGLYFYGTNGRQLKQWGNGSSFQCVVPPVKRAGPPGRLGQHRRCVRRLLLAGHQRPVERQPAQEPGRGRGGPAPALVPRSAQHLEPDDLDVGRRRVRGVPVTDRNGRLPRARFPTSFIEGGAPVFPFSGNAFRGGDRSS